MIEARGARPTRIHRRGDFRQPGDEVSPATPSFLPLLPRGSPDRLALASWLVDGKNPLTGRVTVNRLWQELFGRGLVVTTENLGARGALPSHPELLDWLACEFASPGAAAGDRGAAWSVKRLLRWMVTSAAYRRSSRVDPKLAERDPGNALLARQSRLRLQAEQVRDSILAASGLLSSRVGGPSVRPPQPASVSQEGFENRWETTPGEGGVRRSLYTFIQRTSPFATFVNFDFPDTSRPCARRTRSNSPLQALNLLNDPAFFDAARHLGGILAASTPADTESRVELGFRLALGRPPRLLERQRLCDFHTRQVASGGGRDRSQDPAAEARAARAAWTLVASVLLNLDEMVTRE